jgi:hypothetical protein
MSTVTPSNDFLQVRPEVQSSRVMSKAQLNDQEIQAMEDQQRKLKYFTDTTNEELQQQQEKELFINLSLVTLFSKMSSTIIDIINELLQVTRDSQMNEIIFIFIQKDRLIYLGMLFVIISLAMYLIDVTQ